MEQETQQINLLQPLESAPELLDIPLRRPKWAAAIVGQIIQNAGVVVEGVSGSDVDQEGVGTDNFLIGVDELLQTNGELRDYLINSPKAARYFGVAKGLILNDEKLTALGKISSRRVDIGGLFNPEQQAERPLKPKADAFERAAHRFRSQRMRMGAMKDITSELQDDEVHKPRVSALVHRRGDLQRTTQRSGEMHRAYAPLISGLMSQPETRRKFMGALDEVVANESADLKVEAKSDAGLQADILILGSGLHGAICAARLRALYPEARIVAIDKGNRLGGQFRSYGNRPVFSINSRNFRPQDNNVLGQPGNGGNLNSFGELAPVQLTDYSHETYPTNLDFGDGVAINQHLSAQTMLNTAFSSAGEYKNGRHEVTAIDTETGEQYTINARLVAVASGPGTREKRQGDNPAYLTAEQVLGEFADENNLFPMDKYVGKTIAIKGFGDTGRILTEIFTRLAPKEAYGLSTVQLGGPKQILVFGTDFANKDEYCDSNRPRYSRATSFIGDTQGNNPDDVLTVLGYPDRLTDVVELGDRFVLYTEDPTRTLLTADIVIDAAQLESDTMSLFKNLGTNMRTLSDVIPSISREEPADFALQLDGTNIFFVGPVTGLPLTEAERKSFADGIRENTISDWANQVRTSRFADFAAERLQKLG